MLSRFSYNQGYSRFCTRGKGNFKSEIFTDEISSPGKPEFPEQWEQREDISGPELITAEGGRWAHRDRFMLLLLLLSYWKFSAKRSVLKQTTGAGTVV